MLKNKLTSVFIVVCIILTTMLSSIHVNALTAEGFDGGNGTSSNPWQISTLAQLHRVRDYLSGHFILTQNIALSGTWQPIGYNTTTNSRMFSGSFNGNGKTISGLYVVGNYTTPTTTSLSTSKVGFFGSTYNATIKNLTLTGTSVSGSTNVGSLIGYSKGNLTVDNCHSSVNVSATGASSGGLIGEAADGMGWDLRGAKISNCSYSGTLNGKGQTGGIVGFAKRAFSSEGDPMITRCKTTGNVSGTTEVGGIVGEAYGRISQCYSTGNITGSGTRVGGIAGSMMASGNINSATAVDYGTYIYDSYSLGNIRGASSVGGIGGYCYETASTPGTGVTRSYAAGTIESTSSANTGGIVGNFSSSEWGSVTYCAVLSPTIKQYSTAKTTVQPIHGTTKYHHNYSYYRSDIQLLARGVTVPSNQNTAIPLAQLRLESTYANTLKWNIGENATWKWNATASRPELNIDPIVLTLPEKTMELEVGEMRMLTSTPSLANNTWWSDNTKVATVVNGLITAVGAGTTTIWVKPSIGNAVGCTVIVKEPDPGAFTVEITLEQGQTTLLNGFVTIKGNTEAIKPEWHNSNPTVASIDATGLVTAISVGTTTITGVNPLVATHVQTIKIAVVPSYPVTGIDIIPETLELAIDQNMGVEYEINPSNANNQRVVWYSSNEAVATVEGGIISAVSSGTATIGVVTVDGGFTDTVTVYVEYSVSEIEVTPSDAVVVKGDDLQMSAAVPGESTAPAVTWSSSDETIATIDSSGVLTGISAGEVIITATSVNYEGVTGSTLVTIREPIVETLANWSEFALGAIAPYSANDGSYYQSSASLTAVGNNIVVSRDAVNKIRAVGWADASDTNIKGWQATFETTGMKNIKFSASQSANNNSPNNFIAEYSLNGATWLPIDVTTDENGEVSSGYFIRTIDENASTQKQIRELLLPSECNNRLVVYVRLRAADSIGVSGNPVPNNTTPSFLHYFTVTGEH